MQQRNAVGGQVGGQGRGAKGGVETSGQRIVLFAVVLVVLFVLAFVTDVVVVRCLGKRVGEGVQIQNNQKRVSIIQKRPATTTTGDCRLQRVNNILQSLVWVRGLD